MYLPPFRRAQRGNTVLQGYFGCFVLSEPGTLVRLVVEQIRKIWMRKYLPIRLFAFFDERHWKSLGESLRRKLRQERPASALYETTGIYIFAKGRGSLHSLAC